ncbi:MAG: glycosyltransferase family 9 protein [Xanthomonadaceae bacterium]|nr:glycosyltransferase family 9 protein [Xanthomonadaceae bacterium]
MERILVVRPDRLGDVVLSLPALTALKSQHPNAQITFAVQSWIAEGLESQLKGIEILKIPHGRREWRELIQSKHFDAAVVLQSKLGITLGIWRAGIPLRVGPVSKLHTWFLFNERIRQNRSRVEKHEAEYNLELMKPLGVEALEAILPKFTPSAEAKFSVNKWKENNDILSRYVVIHPGMGGSAENWPVAQYQKLVRDLTDVGVKVVLSYGGNELKLVNKIKGSTNAIIFGEQDPRSLSELGALFTGAQCVVAPSTGPLHWATLFGVPVVSFYPTIRVQSAKRWGPLVSLDKKTVFVPDVTCRAIYRCNGAKCPDYPCMQKIPAQPVLNAVIKYYEA